MKLQVLPPPFLKLKHSALNRSFFDTTADPALRDEGLRRFFVVSAFLGRELADYLVNLDQFHHSLGGIQASWLILPRNPSKSKGLSPF